MPVLALFPALVLDNLARRAEAVFLRRAAVPPKTARWIVTAAVAILAAALIWREARFYFVDYAKMDGWPSTRVETNAVRFQGTDTLVTSLGRYAHAVNSG